ncbi:DNA-directed RNA polymerase subunit beta [Treponema berlinense]|uniref:DNA-directed RNA polymerase subunit beta n=2 Tax=Treponema berlinense TaxID=225004 RepID=A0A1T4PFQ6_9SPIR|nr:DNA-directed RNA polymerase subunit beta [Treponema berlinense]MCI5540965.1 DNA-directed RNA polymerase subunit beta [Treponema berlinense]MDY3708155.1 DNA-directed RNA polymerase subunit beta [Treponema berlinense]SJZ90395.1 DNA-directed RNA polymerase subunit beta [Treponema berlinense]
MFAKSRTINRQYFGKNIQNFMEIPNLIDIQLSSYESFLQKEKLDNNEPLENKGLQEVFDSTFPIESPDGNMSLEYEFYKLEEENIKFTELQCKQKGLTYSVPLKARINLNFKDTGAILQKDIYMGDIPLMTDRGTFIVNGAERVVVSQIHRSPGVIFNHEKGVYSSRIIPYRGSWLEFEIDQKKDLIYAKIDRKKKILGTIFLRALGFSTREEIIDQFYETETVAVDAAKKEELVDKVLARAVKIKNEDGEEKVLLRAGSTLHMHEVDDLISQDVKEITIILFDARKKKGNKEEHNPSLDSRMIINCFEREDMKYTKEGASDEEPTLEDALTAVFSILKPGEPMAAEAAKNELEGMFFNIRHYDLGRVGRYKLNKKFDIYSEPVETHTLVKSDIINTMKHLVKVYIGNEVLDDIDHLGNRRIRSVGELMTNSLKTAFARMERIAKERMSLKETETMKPQDLISIKPIVAAIKEFFGSSQLSQFMDQINPLSELTHKRRLNALGPGGLSRDRAGFEVRDVHYTHYGRMCPIETPEGPNIGLIVSLAIFTRVNEYGFLETPYRKVVDGKATDTVEYLSAMDEDRYYIGQVAEGMKADGSFPTEMVSCRHVGDYTTRNVKDIQYMDVSPRQVISVSASLVPFLEHDDANRALMGCNMQRQGVPLLFPEPPFVGTGMEAKAAYDSGVLIKAKHDGEVVWVESDLIKVKVDGSDKIDEYPLLKYQRTNNDTCNHQRPTVEVGEKVKKGDVLADGPATFNGELSLGRNLLVGFVPWNGYNYEDAVLISRRVVKEDMYTSIHIKEFQTEIRETKLGPEKITRDVPNTSEKMLNNLDAEGIIRIGAKVRSGDILVGKVTPKSETETTPEFKLLNSIFGEKAKEVRDSSLRVPHGIEGVIIDVQRMKRTEGDDLNPGVDEVVKVLIANKRKLREGDKMAGRHGNKGVVARILPEEDMPYLADGTPLDVCLNPLGVPSRMNIGQIMESELGIVGRYLNQYFESPAFQTPSQEQIAEKLVEAGLSPDCKQIVRDGRTGEPFVNPIFVGVIYFLKLHHLVDDKMHARSTGPYSLVTQQPLGGKAQFGGQRLGEMEVWALEAYGAANTLQEMMTIKSDDMNGRSKVYESIVKGDPTAAAGVPESFNVMVQELRGLALDFKIYDAKGKRIALTERDQELIDKASSGFEKENEDA